MQIFINILIMIVILGVEISIHEAGHLAMAKLFKVYCFEYSIGFGPKLLHVKRKKGETYFSIRAFPVGGYVSMYGEADGIPDGMQAPPKERSLLGIKRWKRALIMSAGVILNYFLGMVLILISVSAFPQYFSGYGLTVVDGDTSNVVSFVGCNLPSGSKAYEAVDAAKSAEYQVSDYYFFEGTRAYPSLADSSQYGYIVDSDVDILVKKDNGNYETYLSHYVAVYAPSALTSDHLLSSDIHLYPASSVDPASVDPFYASIGITAFPDASKGEFSYSDKTDGSYQISVDVPFLPVSREDDKATVHFDQMIRTSLTMEIASSSWSDPGITLKVISERYNASEIWDAWSYYVPYCTVAIIKGLGGLFTASGWSNISGIIGMTAAVGTYSSLGGAAMIFLYAGLISINLAIFNLLPFPGLDGWQLLVTAIEGGTNAVKRRKWKKEHESSKEEGNKKDVLPSKNEANKEVIEEANKPLEEAKQKEEYQEWRIPPKVNGIISYIGLGLLLLLMVAVMIKDIIGLF